MSGHLVPELDAAHRAALSSGKPLVCECPPAWWFTQPVIDSLRVENESALKVIVVVPQIEHHDDVVRVLENNSSLAPAHLCTGLTRTKTLLGRNAVKSLVTTPADLAALVSQSALKPDGISHVILAWPELYGASATKPVEECLAEMRSSQRIIITSDLSAIPDLVERYARRAPVYRSGIPSAPADIVLRYAVVPSPRREAALRGSLDSLNPATTVVWDPTGQTWSIPGVLTNDDDGQQIDLAVFMELPAANILEDYMARAKSVLLLIRPTQIPFLHKLAVTPTALTLPSSADRARDRAAIVRSELRERLTGNMPMGILTTLEPLLDEFDPVEIAAAALMGTWDTKPDPEPATWTRIRTDIGKKDNVRAGDLVGALVNAVGLQPSDIGRIDLRDSFAIIEVRPEDSSKAIQGLTGTAIRGKRLTARLDDVRRAASPRTGKPIRSRRPSGPGRA